jgi:molybdate transport system substrate-binding protein
MPIMKSLDTDPKPHTNAAPKRWFSTAFWLLAISLMSLTPAWADEVRVLAAGAAKHAVQVIAPAFLKATGHTLVQSFDTVGAQRDRVLQAAPGSVADIVILSDAALQTLRSANRLTGAAELRIGRVVVAVAVPGTAAKPDISTLQAFRQALIDAPSIAYADPARGATAGTHFAKVIEALGLEAALQNKTTRMPFGVDVIKAVSEGRYAIGISQSSEIMQHPGINFAGGLPEPYALSTAYGAALSSTNAAAAQFIQFLAEPQNMAAFASSGFVATPKN